METAQAHGNGRDELPDVPRGTVTFLFTDIEGSTRLLERLREQYATVLADQRDLLRAALARYNGHEIDTQGDSFFIAFPRALDAVQCAAAAQQALAAHAWPQDVRVRVRMGLHTGEPLLARTGYVGMDVHRAARIAAAGYGGQVLLSQTTRDLVYQDLPPGITLRHLGEHQLKDIRFPQPIFQLDIDGLPADFPALKTLTADEPPPTPGDPPFRGLQFFTEADAHSFFGRDELTGRLVELVCGQRFLAVVGASGSGKSSLVRAGLAPALRRGRLRAGQPVPCSGLRWQVHVLTPTAHPLQALATSLTRDQESVFAAATLLDDLGRDARSLHLFVHRLLRLEQSGAQGVDRLLLIVDQFEELFTLCRAEAERQAFLDNLLTAATTEPGGASLVITLRADFYEHLAPYPALSHLVAEHQAYLGAMTAAELRQAIEAPAALGGWTFSTGLVDLLLHDVGADEGRQPEPGALPLLSHALLETWKRRRANLMNLRAYAESGGVRGAIARTAEGVFFQDLTSAQQAIARDIFLRLTELGEGTQDTRRRASYSELLPQGDARQVEEVLARLADARLITTTESTVEVAHEALIREWPTLRQWLAEDRDGLRLRRHLTEAAQAWERLSRDPGELYRGARLAHALEWAERHGDELNVLERSFLTASQEAAEREAAERESARQRELTAAQQLAEAEKQRAETQARAAAQLRRWAVYLVGALVVALLAAGAAGFFGQRASQSAALANENLSTAQAAEATAQGEADARATQQTIAEANFTRAEAQRLAAEANKLALANGTSDLIALLALRSLALQYSPQGDAALMTAASLDFPARSFEAQVGVTWVAAFSPDSRRLFTIPDDGLVRVYDVDSTQPLQTIRLEAEYWPDTYFTPDSQSLFILATDDRAQIWDIETGQKTREFTLPGCGSAVWPAWQSDSEVLIGCDDHTIQLWDLVAGQKLDEWVFEDERPIPLHDGLRALSYSEAENAYRLWDIRSGLKLQTFVHEGIPVQTDWPSPLSISLDDRLVAIRYRGGSISVWDTASGEQVQSIAPSPNSGPTWTSTAISPDNRYLFTAGQNGEVGLWEIATGQQVRGFRGHNGDVFPAAFSRDGRFVLTSSTDGTAKLWNVEPRPELPTLIGHQNAVSALDLSPDGRLIATAGWDDTLRVWDAETGEPQRVMTGTGNINFGMRFSPDGTQIVTVNQQGGITLWDWESAKPVYQVATDGFIAYNDVAFSPDGRYFATPGMPTVLVEPPHGYALVFDRSTGVEAFRFPISETFHLNFSPDGRYLATAFDRSPIARIWDLRTHAQIQEFSGHEAGTGIVQIAFSPDGRYLATGGYDTTARLWDVQTGQEVMRFAGHSSMLWGMAFSRDGTMLATASVDQTVRVWDVRTGQELRRYVGHTAAVENVVFSADGRRVISVSDDFTGRFWAVDYHDTIAYLCSRLLRDLSEAERAQFQITDPRPTCPP